MFLAPAFLAGLLAIAVPIWLHRVAKANPTRHPFASLMLLESTETQRTAKRTLRYLLLLALRIALLLALIFAFAGPLVSPRAVPKINPDARLHAIVLDASLSMQYADRWQRALEQARTLIAATRAGDQVLLVLGKGRQIEVLYDSRLTADRGSLNAVLQQARPGMGRLDYGLLTTTASGWLGPRTLPVEMHLITDLQQSASPLRFADLEPPSGVHAQLYDVSGGDSVNAYIKNATLTAADGGTLAVEIGALSVDPQTREVVVTIDGKELGRKPAALRSGEVVKVNFQSLQLAPGTRRIEVALAPQDALQQDDRFYAVVEHADPRVMLVARSAAGDDTAYVAAAIESLSAPRLNVEQHTAQAVEDRALQGYSTLVVTDVAALGSRAAARIDEYVRAGGTLLLTLGAGAAQADGLLQGLRVRDVSKSGTRVGRIDSAHPVLRDASGWQEIRFFQHLRVTPAEDDKVLIALLDGSPLLIERSAGAGRMLIFTSPLDREWNDFATHPLFVRFMGEAARYLAGAGVAAASSQVGAVVMTGLTAQSGGQIFDPRQQRVLGLNESSADRLVPDQAGFYEVRGTAGTRWLAVNVDARESDLTPLPAQAVQRWRDLRSMEDASIAADLAVAPAAPLSLGYWLLLLAVALLAAEILMANHYLAVRREAPR